MGGGQWRERWRELNAAQQRIVIVMGGVTLLALIALVYWGQRPSYRVLYSELSAEDAGRVVEYLQNQGVRYRLARGGAAVEVDQGRVYDLRLKLAQEGLPRGAGGVGFELFDVRGLPGSDFSNQVTYQRALQGELERTISSLGKVQGARVHLVLPKYDLYSGPQSASASVMVDARGGQALSPAEVDGIIHLVAQAVQGMAPEAVVVIDARGEILSGGGSSGRLSLGQLNTQREYEGQLQRMLQQMLDRTLGENCSLVQVQADLDFDEERVRSQSLLPAGGRGSMTEEEVAREEYAGRGPAAGGVAGVANNLERMPGQAGGETGGVYSHTQESRRYEYGREERELVKAPGQVRRLTVAAVVDSETAAGTERQVADLLRAAAGIQEERGDHLVVQRMDLAAKEQAELAREEAREAELTQRRQGMISAGTRYGVLLLLGMILAGAVLSAARQMRPTTAGAEQGVLQTTATQEEAGPRAEPPPAGAAVEEDLERIAREDPGRFAEEIRRLIGPRGG